MCSCVPELVFYTFTCLWPDNVQRKPGCLSSKPTHRRTELASEPVTWIGLASRSCVPLTCSVGLHICRLQLSRCLSLCVCFRQHRSFMLTNKCELSRQFVNQILQLYDGNISTSAVYQDVLSKYKEMCYHFELHIKLQTISTNHWPWQLQPSLSWCGSFQSGSFFPLGRLDSGLFTPHHVMCCFQGTKLLISRVTLDRPGTIYIFKEGAKSGVCLCVVWPLTLLHLLTT